MYRSAADDLVQSGANYKVAIEGCEERHEHIPQVSPQLKRELQKKADDYTEYNGILVRNQAPLGPCVGLFRASRAYPESSPVRTTREWTRWTRSFSTSG